MEFWYGVVFTLLIETVVLICATEWLRKKVDKCSRKSCT